MRRLLVYDLPTRLFHWLFAGLFLTAFIIGKTVDDESQVFTYHMLVGLAVGFLVLLRFGWNMIGTTHAQFKNFALSPSDLFNYFIGILTGDKRKWAGHNPASSWAGLIMMALAMGSAVTGYMMTSGLGQEEIEDIHEIFANSLIIVVGLHVLGIIIHTVRHKEMIGLSMVDGCKEDVASNETITSSRPFFGFVFFGLVLAFGFNLYKNYNPQKNSVSFFGTTLQLGEKETEGKESPTAGVQGGAEYDHEEDEDGDY